MKTLLIALNLFTLVLLVIFAAAVISLESFYIVLIQALPFILFISLIKQKRGRVFRYGTLALNFLAVLGGSGGFIEIFGTDPSDQEIIVSLAVVFFPFVLVASVNFLYVLTKVKI